MGQQAASTNSVRFLEAAVENFFSSNEKKFLSNTFKENF